MYITLYFVDLKFSMKIDLEAVPSTGDKIAFEFGKNEKDVPEYVKNISQENWSQIYTDGCVVVDRTFSHGEVQLDVKVWD